MKKIILLVTICIITISQTIAASGVQFGIRLNPNIGWLSAELQNQADTVLVRNKGARLGISYGLAADINFTDNYGLVLEFRLSNQGGTYIFEENIDGEDFRTEYKLKLQYFEIPILLKLKTNEIGYLTYFAQFGINTGINFRPKADIYTDLKNSDGEVISDRDNVAIGEDIKPFRFGLQIGAGVHYSLGAETAIYGGFSYFNGFSHLFRERIENDLIDRISRYKPLITNNYVSLDLGIMF